MSELSRQSGSTPHSYLFDGHLYCFRFSDFTQITLPGLLGLQHFCQGSLTGGIQISRHSTSRQERSSSAELRLGTHVLQGTSRLRKKANPNASARFPADTATKNATPQYSPYAAICLTSFIGSLPCRLPDHLLRVTVRKSLSPRDSPRSHGGQVATSLADIGHPRKNHELGTMRASNLRPFGDRSSNRSIRSATSRP